MTDQLVETALKAAQDITSDVAKITGDYAGDIRVERDRLAEVVDRDRIIIARLMDEQMRDFEALTAFADILLCHANGDDGACVVLRKHAGVLGRGQQDRIEALCAH